MNDPLLVEQVRSRVEQALLRLGQRSSLRVEGEWLLVGKGASVTRADLRGTLVQWDSLPEDLRERRVEQIAQLLAEGEQRAPIAPRPQRLSNKAGWLSGARPLFVVLLTGAALLLAYRVLSPHGDSAFGDLSRLFGAPAPSSSAPAHSADPDRDRALLAASACAQTRARVARGAAVGPADVEGWVVELVLLRRGPLADLSLSPELAQFIRREPSSNLGTWVWPNARALVAAQRFDAQVAVQALPSLGHEQLSGLSVLFTGPYVVPYFTAEQRSDYELLASSLAESLGATDGALFAHCANAGSAAIGSWFLGADPGAAIGSLIYFMAGSSDLPILKPEVLGVAGDPRSRDHAFDAIGSAARSLDRGAVAALIGRELGMISGRPKQPSHVTFPFRDANRAARASVDAARALQLARDR